MDLKLQRIAAWCGVTTLAALLASLLLIAGLIPPMSPTLSASENAQFLIDNKLRIRLGIAVAMIGVCLQLPFMAVVCLRVRRIEGKWGILSMTELFAGVIYVPGLLFPLMVMAAAAFRPERPAEVTQAVTDVFWLMFVGVVGPILIFSPLLALATFIDRGEPRTFPRWFGYLNIWYAIMAAPGGAVMIFNDGPLAWNGVFAFWIPLVAFSVWMITLTLVTDASLKAEHRAEQQPVLAST